MPPNNKIEIPLIEATDQNLKGYGYLVNNFDQCLHVHEPFLAFL